MESTTERDRRLAEALKPLALPPPSPPLSAPSLPRVWPPRGVARQAVFLASLLALATVLLVAAPRFRSPPTANVPGAAGEASTTSLPDRTGVRSDEGSAANGAPPAVREISGSGYVVARQTTAVYAKYEGRIVSIAVELGARVDAGQVLMVLDNADTRFALEQAKARKVTAELEYAGAEIDLEQARVSLNRVAGLAASRAVSRQQLDDAATAFKRATNALAQARQKIVEAGLAVRMASDRAEEQRIRAPISGVVTRLNAHVGDSVLARADSVRESQSLLSITDTRSMVIDADVAETNLAALRPGMRGDAVLDGFPDQAFAIEVQRLAPVVSLEKGTIALRLTLTDPPVGIRPNMAARIRIPTQVQPPPQAPIPVVVPSDATPGGHPQ